MKHQKMKPQIRFKDFTSPWVRRNLEEIFTIRTEKNENRYTREDVLAVSDKFGCVNQIEFHGRSFAGDDISNYKVVHTGDIVYTKSPLQAKPYGIIKIVGKEEGIVSPLYVVNKTADNYCALYMYYLFDLPEKTNGYLTPLVRKGAKNTMNISDDEWLSGSVVISPDLKEQKKISEYFSLFDQLIALHQYKFEKLCDLKKAMLLKLFPEVGMSIPKIRFKGYTKSWKSWTLGELYTERKEAGSEGLPILSVSIHSGVSADELASAELGKAVRRSEDKSLYKHTYKGDLVFNMMRAWQGAIGVVPKEGMVSPAYITAIPNDEIYPEFMDYCLRRDEVINQINNLSYGVTDFRKRLYWDSFVRVEIMLPSVEEQRKITTILVQLDKLIELQSAKVEKLKNLKAACLEKMFV